MPPTDKCSEAFEAWWDTTDLKQYFAVDGKTVAQQAWDASRSAERASFACPYGDPCAHGEKCKLYGECYRKLKSAPSSARSTDWPGEYECDHGTWAAKCHWCWQRYAEQLESADSASGSQFIEQLARAAGWVGASADPKRYLEKYVARTEKLAGRGSSEGRGA